VTITREQKEM